MSRYKLLFYGTEKSQTEEHTLECFVNHNKEIFIQIDDNGHNQFICLDVSTAIKFSKTLRTEINKAKDE